MMMLALSDEKSSSTLDTSSNIPKPMPMTRLRCERECATIDRLRRCNFEVKLTFAGVPVEVLSLQVVYIDMHVEATWIPKKKLALMN
jgi:hypothetical protein